MEYQLQFLQYNERSILIEWPAVIDQNILESILSFKKYLQKKYIKEKVEIINTYNTILIIYKCAIDNVNDAFCELNSLFNTSKSIETIKPLIWEIPVCYEDNFGLDLELFSKEKKLSKSEIIELHSQPIYTVFFIGFLPGFLYLGGLDSKLYLDRKSTPDLNIKKGAVAIGGEQTGIYPQNSPGGWHIIGSTPIEMFNASNVSPCKINAGDKVRFRPISKLEYLDIESRVVQSTFQLKPIRIDA